jgi:diguanylate cyclase (GGDEF)-like protein/PAS domain S-box-containing protein
LLFERIKQYILAECKRSADLLIVFGFGVIIFLAEGGVMMYIAQQGFQEVSAVALFDSIALTLLLVPVLYFLILRPLRRRSEALRQKEQDQSVLLRHIPDMVWFKDAESRFVMVNQAFERMTGLTNAELRGKGDDFVWRHNREWQSCLADDRESREIGKALVREKVLTMPGTESRVFETVRTPMFDETGRFRGTIVVARDITQRFNDQRRKRRRDFQVMFSHLCRDAATIEAVSDALVAQLVEVLDVSRVALWSWDRSSDLLHCVAQSATDLNLLGVTDIDGRQCPRYIAALDRRKPLVAEVVASDEALRELTDRYLGSLDIRSKLDIPIVEEAWSGVLAVETCGRGRHWTDGETNFLSAVADMYFNAYGRIRGDQMAARNQVILQTSKDAVVIIDEKGVIESFNHAAEDIFGYSAEEAIGQNVSMLAASPHREQHDAYIGRYLETGKPHIIGLGREVEGCRKDGSIVPISLNISEFVIGGKRGFTGVIRDLTQLKHTEAELWTMTKLAGTDALTGVMSRHALVERLGGLITSANRYQRPFSIAMADIDHFKRVNDEYGHQAGDIVLRLIAAAFHDALRDTDYIGRYGGEEFLFLMPEITLDQAEATLQRIRSSIADMDIDIGQQTIRITFSAGVAEYQPGESLDQLIGRVDQALYRAKREGRNRISKEE